MPMHQPPATVSRNSRPSTTTYDSNPDNHSNRSLRQSHFVYRNGSKLHAFDRETLPYPLSYDREVLEAQSLDFQTVDTAQNGVHIYMHPDHNGRIPKRCLDLGTGLGLWVVFSAKIWPKTTFVGLDAVNVQIPLSMLAPDVAVRIEWLHANFLTARLPFKDEEFDHVRIGSIAQGMPEHKWNGLFEELLRVMKPGATIEIIEEDLYFPVLPRWFTEPLRAHARGRSYPRGSQRMSLTPIIDTSMLEHEHELLETLFKDVFARRYINMFPTSVIPAILGMYFENIMSPPVMCFYMPHLAPFPPIPGLDDAWDTTEAKPVVAERSESYHGETYASQQATLSRKASRPRADTLPKNTIVASPAASVASLATGKGRDTDSISRTSSTGDSVHSGTGRSKGSSRSSRGAAGVAGYEQDGAAVGGDKAEATLGMDRLAISDEHSRYVHLYRAFLVVLGVKEAMWDELVLRVKGRDERLRRYGWRSDDYTEDASRAKFDFYMEQYHNDMRVRIAMWNCMVQSGWEYPRREPLSHTQILEEQKLRNDMLEAQHKTDNEEAEVARTVRLVLGVKPR